MRAIRRILILALIATTLAATCCFAAPPVIFDTDVGSDVDDVLALAMLHALTDRGECELIGVLLSGSQITHFTTPFSAWQLLSWKASRFPAL